MPKVMQLLCGRISMCSPCPRHTGLRQAKQLVRNTSFHNAGPGPPGREANVWGSEWGLCRCLEDPSLISPIRWVISLVLGEMSELVEAFFQGDRYFYFMGQGRNTEKEGGSSSLSEAAWPLHTGTKSQWHVSHSGPRGNDRIAFGGSPV